MINYLCVAQLHDPLLEHADVRDAEGVEQGDAADGRHGLHGEVVHHRVRHDAPHEPALPSGGGSGRRLRRWLRRREERHLRAHVAATRRADQPAQVRHVATE